MSARTARLFYGFNALVALVAVGLSFTLAVTGFYVDTMDPSKPTLLGNVPGGNDTVLERLLDWSTYFTILSNVVVLVVTAALTLKPSLFTRQDRVGAVWRALRLDSVLMIIVTGVIYNLLLAGGEKAGWDLLSNSMLHIVMPIVTPIVWLIAGPRGLINVRVIAGSLILPLLWAAYALVRGQVIGAYPYPFLDVPENGLASVLGFIAIIVVIAVVLALVMWGLDTWIGRMTARRGAAAPAQG